MKSHVKSKPGTEAQGELRGSCWEENRYICSRTIACASVTYHGRMFESMGLENTGGEVLLGVALLSKPSISRKKWELLETVHLKKTSVIKGKPNHKPRKELPRASLTIYLSWH